MTSSEELRKLTDEYLHKVYEMVKMGSTYLLSGQSLSIAQAIQEHMDLTPVCNALEFADVREGQPYLMEHESEPMSPVAHIATHATVKNCIKEDEAAGRAFEKLLSDGVSKHHAEHLLAMIFSEALWYAAHRGDAGRWNNSLKKLSDSRTFRTRWIEKTSDQHPWAE